MTGYNTAHGDTAAVRLDLCGEQGMYREYQRCTGIAWWDADDSTWKDIDKAREALHEYVVEVQTYARAAKERGQYGEIVDADLVTVDFTALITDELTQKNLDEGRSADAGL